VESTESAPPDSKPPEKKRRKGRIRTFAIIAVVLVVVIVVLWLALGGGTPKPKSQFEIASHTAYAEENTNGTFNATVEFRVNNTGNVAGNVTVIFKVKNGGYVWAGAQIFYMEPGQSFFSYKKHIPVSGDADSDWVYQCYLSGIIQPPWYPHD
jgi:hypothetical protein